MLFRDRINQFALEVFADLQKAEEEYQRAETELRKYSKPTGDAEYMAKAARAKADFEVAQISRRNVQRDIPGKVSETLAQMRREYKAEIEKKYGVDAADIDMKQLELLKSGIMKPGEYSTMMNNAAEAGNATMARLIAKYAGEAAEVHAKKYGANDPGAFTLRMVANTAIQDPADAALRVYDGLTDIIQRTVNNPGLIPYWEQFTTPLFEQL